MIIIWSIAAQDMTDKSTFDLIVKGHILQNLDIFSTRMLVISLYSCIKVDYHDKGCRQTLKEAEYYQKLRRFKPSLEYDFIPRFHGMIETNRGIGGIFDLV